MIEFTLWSADSRKWTRITIGQGFFVGAAIGAVSGRIGSSFGNLVGDTLGLAAKGFTQGLINGVFTGATSGAISAGIYGGGVLRGVKNGVMAGAFAAGLAHGTGIAGKGSTSGPSGSQWGDAVRGFPIIGEILGAGADVLVGLGKFASGNFRSGASNILYGYYSANQWLAEDVHDAFFGNTVGKVRGLYNVFNRKNGEAITFRKIATSLIVPNFGPAAGANVGGWPNGIASDFEVNDGFDTRIDHASIQHDISSGIRMQTGERLGPAHRTLINQMWTGPGAEPGPLGQVYRALGTTFFGPVSLID